MSARADTLPIGGRGNWSKWAAALAVAVGLAVAAALLFNLVTGSKGAAPAPKVVPSELIQAPTAPAYAPTAGSHAGGPSTLRPSQYGHLPNTPSLSLSSAVAPDGEPVAPTTAGCQLCPR